MSFINHYYHNYYYVDLSQAGVGGRRFQNPREFTLTREGTLSIIELVLILFSLQSCWKFCWNFVNRMIVLDEWWRREAGALGCFISIFLLISDEWSPIYNIGAEVGLFYSFWLSPSRLGLEFYFVFLRSTCYWTGQLVEGAVTRGAGSILLKYCDATNPAWTIEICHQIATDNLLRLSMDYLLQ